MTRFAALAAGFAALLSAPALAMSPDDNPVIGEANLVYSQCLTMGAARAARIGIADQDAFAAAKANCAGQRDAIIASSNGHVDVIAALDAVEAEKRVTFADRTRAIRAMRVAVRVR